MKQSSLHNRPNIRQQIIDAYNNTGSILKVAELLHVSTKAASTVLHEEGVTVDYKRLNCNYPDESCYNCRHFSRTSTVYGFCLSHRRSVMSRDQVHCFTK